MKVEITIEAFSSTTQVSLNGNRDLIEKILEAIKKVANEYSHSSRVD